MYIKKYKLKSSTTICYKKYSYGKMFRLYWVFIRPSKKQTQRIKIYSAFWDPIMHYKFWHIGSVLWKAWWWLNRVETCYEYVSCNKLLCLTEIYTLYELDKHIGMTNVKSITQTSASNIQSRRNTQSELQKTVMLFLAVFVCDNWHLTHIAAIIEEERGIKQTE
jgi:hypothetical protein